MQTSFPNLIRGQKKLTRRDHFGRDRGGHAVGRRWRRRLRAVLPEGRRSRPATGGLHRMLRMYIAQQC